MDTAKRTTILLFGDQTAEFATSIRHVVSTSKKSSRVLRKFLQDAVHVVQIEIRKLPCHESNKPLDDAAFQRLLEEPESFEDMEDPMGIMQTVMSCIARLGELILQVERDPSLVSDDKELLSIGLCTGLLSAVVLSAARNLEDLLNLAAAMVGVAFRLRVDLHHRSRQIEAVHATWGYLVVGLGTQEAERELERYHDAKVCCTSGERVRVPTHKRAYIAVAADTWITVFGAPSTMQHLLQHSPAFSRASSTKLYRATGAVHANHLPPVDLERVIGSSELFDRDVRRPIRLYSTSFCSPFEATSMRDLLRDALEDILHRRLEFTGTLDAVANAVPRENEADVISVGATAAVASFQKAVERGGITMSLIDGVQQRPQEQGVRSGSGKIAIVGVSGRFPGSDSSVNGFWQALLDEREMHKKVPPDRWRLDAWQHALGPDAELPYGCWLERPGEFDARLFNISPREAAQMEPIHRLLLLVTYEALWMSGYAPEATPATDRRRISAFFGQSSDDWRDVNHQHGIETHYVPCIARAFGAGRLHHYFKWEGPAFTVDSACGSSAAAITLACSALNAGDCDTALAGGGLLACSPDAFAGLVKGGFISPTGGCKVFRDDVDGYCRGEAVAMVVLKRLEDAQMDKDNILGVIEGHARNHSAYAQSITHPHQPSQESVFKQALHAACTDPRQIGYVEAHGTGTTAGDVCEVSAIANALGTGRTAQDPLIMGAVKANVGHGESAAAVVALTKVLMVLKNRGLIPSQPGFADAKLNPSFPALEERSVHVAQGRHRQLQPGQKILLNCFDATGGNTCMVVAPPPEQPAVRDDDPRTHHLVVCSGHTFTAMKKNQRRLLDYVMANRNEPVRHLAYTTTARRLTHHLYREAYVVTDMEQLGLRLLEAQANTNADAGIARTKSIMFAFTGQGSCYRSMGSDLFQTSPRFRLTVESCEAVCKMHDFPSVVAFFTTPDRRHSMGDAHAAAQEQLALVSLQIGLVSLLRAWGVRPQLVLGHSIGEYAALYAAGVISLADTIYLVGKRTELLRDSCTPREYAMLVIALPEDQVRGVIARSHFSNTCISCKNTPTTTVCSGPTAEIERLQDTLKREAGIKTHILEVAYGYHSPHVAEAADALKNVAKQAQFNHPDVPVASALLGGVVRNAGTFSADYLGNHTRRAVDMVGALNACHTEGLISSESVCVEVGPDAICSSMVRSCGVIQDTRRLLPMLRREKSCWVTIHELLASLYLHGVDLDWTSFHADFLESLRLVELAPYAFDSTDYWRSYQCDAPRAIDSEVRVESVVSVPYLSPFLHQKVEQGTNKMRFISRVSHPEMVAVAQGHLVDGTPIFPGSAFCEMGYTAAEQLLENASANLEGAYTSTSGMVLTELDMRRPLIIATAVDDSIIHTSATLDATGILVEYSVTAGSETSDLGSLRIELARDGAICAKTGPTASFLVRSRRDALIAAVRQGSGHTLRRSVIYRLFSRYIGYGSSFQGLEECFLNEECTEAAATVRLVPRPTATGDPKACSCYWRDTVFHLAGFMLNGHPDARHDEAYIAVGVSGITFDEPLSEEATYSVYTYMQPTETGAIGDVYVFRDEQIVALCSDMVYKRVVIARHTHAQSTVPKQKIPGPPVQRAAESAPAVRRPPSLSTEEIMAQINPSQTKPVESQHKPEGMGPERTDGNAPETAELILRAIADETSWPYESLENEARLADLGVDSLMSIVITSKLRSQHGVEMPSAKFRNCETVADVRRNFGKTTGGRTEPIPASRAGGVPAEDVATPDVHLSIDSVTTRSDAPERATSSRSNPSSDSEPSSSSTLGSIGETRSFALAENDPTLAAEHSVEVFLISDSSDHAGPPLFLVPDGSGSITSLLALPQFPSGITIYGLHSPWVDDPGAFTCTIEQASRLYLEAVRAKQPHGPYLFGGWSAGCVFAYELAKQLLEADEEVLGLIIIDMHVPKPLPEWIDTTKELWEFWCQATGLDNVFAPLPSGKGLEEHLIQNFRALNKYQPIPMKPGKRPKHGTLIIWATKGMGNARKENSGDFPDPLGIGKWFCFDRTDFSPRGWDVLVGDQVECVAIEGNHRSIMVPPEAENLVRVIEKGLARFLGRS
ncbi:polyketide synthase [Lecanosticta acicola]|uniref:Polyketide synthase n=1 Tax=Lecanosticta acicola TaxID=111012 RepID=A0AAI8Z9C3_9PEZI|nr:polyketide synthase [Lecanosticta acicola]